MCTGRPMQEGGIYTIDADIQPPRNPTNTKQSVMTCPILKRPADCTRPGPSRLSFTQKPRPKQCVGELEILGSPQLPGPSFPAYESPPTANRRVHWWGFTTLQDGSRRILPPVRLGDVFNEFNIILSKTSAQSREKKCIGLSENEAEALIKKLPIAFSLARRYTYKTTSKPVNIPVELVNFPNEYEPKTGKQYCL